MRSLPVAIPTPVETDSFAKEPEPLQANAQDLPEQTTRETHALPPLRPPTQPDLPPELRAVMPELPAPRPPLTIAETASVSRPLLENALVPPVELQPPRKLTAVMRIQLPQLPLQPPKATVQP